MYLARQAAAEFDFGPVKPGNHGPIILGITGFFTAFACAAVMLRMYVRIFMLKMMGGDDYMMLVAMACSAVVFGFLATEVRLGVGLHFGNPHLMINYQDIVHWSFYHAWILVIGISSVKVSVGLFLLRLVQGRWYKRCIVGWIVFLVAFTIACVGTLVFQCLPVNGAWNFAVKFDPKTKCYPLETFRNIGLFNGAINLFTDFVFATLPIPIIIPLQINIRTKVSLLCILSLGYFACAASIVKEVKLSGFFNDQDNLFNDSFNVWSDVELNTGILAACLPTLRPLFASILKNASTKLTDSQSRPKITGDRHRYFPQENDKELATMTSASVVSSGKDSYGVRISGGKSPFDDEAHRLFRQDSVASSPTSRLEKAIEENDSGSDDLIAPRLGGLHSAYVKRGRERRDWLDEREWQDPGRGILRTTEVSVTR